jgi:hypothetical protein
MGHMGFYKADFMLKVNTALSHQFRGLSAVLNPNPHRNDLPQPPQKPEKNGQG